MLKIGDYLDENSVIFFQASSQKEALEKLVKKAFDQNKVTDFELFLKKVEDREKIVSTGVGLSVAIPHAKLQGYDDFFIIVGILSKGIDWHAIDGHPVRIIFLIGGPDDKQNEYLQILSTLTSLIKEEDFRKKLLTTNSPKDIVNFLSTS